MISRIKTWNTEPGISIIQLVMRGIRGIWDLVMHTEGLLNKDTKSAMLFFLWLKWLKSKLTSQKLGWAQMEPLLGLNSGMWWDFAGGMCKHISFQVDLFLHPHCWPLCGAHSNHPFDWSRYVSSIGTWQARIFGPWITYDFHWFSRFSLNFGCKSLDAKSFCVFFGWDNSKKTTAIATVDQRDRRLDPSDWFVAAISNVVPPWSFASKAPCSARWHTSATSCCRELL